jgi:hypothetical protein
MAMSAPDGVFGLVCAKARAASDIQSFFSLEHATSNVTGGRARMAGAAAFPDEL